MTTLRFSIVAAFLLAGCDTASRDTSRADAIVIRDSAGITIVENLVSQPPGVERWFVDTVPTFRIGVESGDPNYEFSDVQGVSRLPNGMIVVLNGQGESAFEFRFFDENGKHVATHGRRGEGPGEFRWVNFFGGTGGDTIVAVDFPARRISWLSARNGFIRSIESDETLLKTMIGERASGLTETMIVLRDSLYAIKSFHPVGDDPRAGRANEFHIVDLSSRSGIRLGRLEEPTRTRLQLSSTTTSVYPQGQTSPMHVVDRTRQRICAGVGHVAEINCIDASGKRMSIRWAYDTIPFTADERRQAEERISISLSKSPQFTPGDIERYRAAMIWPKAQPPYIVLQMDSDGNIWVSEQIKGPSGQPTSRFRIFNADGKLIAFANHFRVRPLGLMDDMEIGSTSLLSAISSPDGVPMVGVYRITRSGADRE